MLTAYSWVECLFLGEHIIIIITNFNIMSKEKRNVTDKCPGFTAPMYKIIVVVVVKIWIR